MLNEEVIDKVIERLVNRIEKANEYVLKEIGGHIKRIKNVIPSRAYQLGQLFKYGGDYDKIVKQLSEITNLNVKEIYEIFEEVAKNDYQFAKQFYKYRNKEYIPYKENIALQNQVKSIARMTANEYLNLSSTFGFTKKIDGKIVYTDLSRMYQEVIDKAVLSVSQGTTTFDEMMKQTLQELGESGLKIVDYASGRTRRLDTAVRMNLKEGLRTLHNETQAVFGEQFGSDGVEVSVHLNPAPDHEEVQGRQFSNEEFYKFQNDMDAVDYKGKLFTADYNGHDRRAISTLNCYHYTFSIVLGVNKPQYSDKELEQIISNNEKGFEFDGKHYTNYEGTQLQRRIETEIRKTKDVQIIAKASDNDELVYSSQERIKQLTRKYKELSDVSGLPTKMERLKVNSYNNILSDEKEINGININSNVNWNSINSAKYKKKLNITENNKVNEQLYNVSNKIFIHRDKTLREDMYLIDGNSGNILASQTNMKTDLNITYNPQMKKIIEKRKNIIAIHNHPLSMPPSIDDINSAFEKKYKLGIVLAHDGTIYTYNIRKMKTKILKREYDIAVEKFTKMYYNNSKRGQMEALNQLSKLYGFEIKEV